MIAVGFEAAAEAGQAAVRPFAESEALAGRHLTTWSNKRFDAVVIGRLHHREEHLRWLATRTERGENGAPSNDAALVASLLAHGGTERLGRLEGDFALAVVDRERRQLVALRDPMGAYPLFAARTAAGPAVSTSIRALTDRLPRAEPDPEFMADYLAFPIDSVAELPTTRTAYAGVQRLRPGSLLEADLATGAVRTKALWDWEREIRSIPVESVEDAGTLVRRTLEQAVAERVSETGGTAAHFSGGFDSTGLALLAELTLSDRGRQLEALTLEYPNSPVLAGERHFVEAALRGRDGLRHRWVEIGEYLELDGHESFPALDEPSAKVVDYIPSLLLTEAAEAAGADAVLVGHGGDQMFFRSITSAVARLLRAGKLRRGRELARAHAPGGRSAPVLQAAAQRALPISVRNGAGALLTTGRETDEMLTHLDVPPWIDRVFAERTGVAERSRALGGPRLESQVFGPSDLPFAAGDWYHWNVAVPRGVAQSRPYFDPRVIKTALGLPVELHLAGGQTKAVLGAALADQLPDAIVTRREKTNVNEFRAGFTRHREWLERLVATAPIPDGVIDRQTLTACVGDAAVGIHDRFSLWRLRMSLTYLLWLSDRDRWAAQRVPFLAPR